MTKNCIERLEDKMRWIYETCDNKYAFNITHNQI